MSGAENRFFCKISDFRIKTCRKIGFFGIFLIFQQRWIFRPKLLIFSTVTNFSRVFAVFFGTAGEAWNVYMPKKYKNEIARSAKIFGFTYLKFVKISSELSEKCLKTHIFDPCSLIHVDLNSSRFSGFWGRAYLLFHPSVLKDLLFCFHNKFPPGRATTWLSLFCTQFGGDKIWMCLPDESAIWTRRAHRFLLFLIAWGENEKWQAAHQEKKAKPIELFTM